MDIHQIVKKLVGRINPVGETQTDEERFENLKIMTALIEKLLEDVNGISRSHIFHEYSVKRAGDFAQKFLTELKEE